MQVFKLKNDNEERVKKYVDSSEHKNDEIN